MAEKRPKQPKSLVLGYHREHETNYVVAVLMSQTLRALGLLSLGLPGLHGTLGARFSQETPPWTMEIRGMDFVSVIESQIALLLLVEFWIFTRPEMLFKCNGFGNFSDMLLFGTFHSTLCDEKGHKAWVKKLVNL